MAEHWTLERTLKRTARGRVAISRVRAEKGENNNSTMVRDRAVYTRCKNCATSI